VFTEFVKNRFISGEILTKEHLCEHYDENPYVEEILEDYWSL